MIKNDRTTKIANAVSDLVRGLCYYDRKEDEDLPVGEIEKAIESGEITVDEIGKMFTDYLRFAIA